MAPSVREERTGSDEPFDVVTLFWGTNRARAAPSKEPELASVVRFGSGRSEKLETGVAQITIPKVGRQQGDDYQRPLQVGFLDVSLYAEKEDPRVHFTIGDVRVVSQSDLVAMANVRNSKAQQFKDHAFVFVHGFNYSFEDALYRTAQLAHDMSFDGPTYLFSWPSKGATAGYLYDKDSVDMSQVAFLEFLTLIATKTNVSKVHIIAHSMGTRLVVDSFYPANGLSSARELPKLGQVILAAADIDAAVLKSRAAANGSSVQAVTLYSNSQDGALQWSKRFAGGAPRAGDVPNGKPIVVAGIDTIDISAMDSGSWVFLAQHHSTYSQKTHVLKDMALLMKNGVRPPDVRFPVYATIADPAGKYWRYVRN